MQFELKKGIVLTKRLNTANLFLVRVMPDMVDIQETELLPTYPMFFKEDNITFAENTEVWVLVSDDFHVGYILGGYVNTKGGTISPLLTLINEAEEKANFTISSPSDISIRSIGGRSILFENIVTGQSGQIFNSKVTHIYSAEGDAYMSYPHTSLRVTKEGDIQLKGRNRVEDLQEIQTKSSSSKEETGLKTVDSVGPIVERASGHIKSVTASYREEATAGDSNELVAKKKKETYGLGQDTTIVAGGHAEKILVGNFTLTVVAGKIELNATAGIHLKSTHISIKALKLDVSSPLFQAPKGGAVIPVGNGPFCALPFCLLTGAPHAGNLQIGGV